MKQLFFFLLFSTGAFTSVLAQVNPVLLPETAVIRGGDTVTINVLANDYDPDGDTLKVVPTGMSWPAHGKVVGYTDSTISIFILIPTIISISCKR